MIDENIYPTIFHLSLNLIDQWKSKNTNPVEFLFLQFFIYYLNLFDEKLFRISIQTRMPVIKTDRNKFYRKFFVEGKTKEKDFFLLLHDNNFIENFRSNRCEKKSLSNNAINTFN